MRSKEQGSVIGFVLGGTLLLALLVGGVMLYKNNISKLTGMTGDSSQVANNDTNKQTDPTVTSDQNQAAQNEAALKQQQEAEKKAWAEKQAVEDAAKAAAAKAAAANSAAQVPHTATAPTSALPTTGPAEDAILVAAGLGLFIGAAIAYRRSYSAL